MRKKLTLGSLFDGSGGFCLGALLTGIEPLWASEVAPFPIRVTTKRLPQVKHLGDINRINGADVSPVDIITGGFCCQDLSVAGKRAGLHGERSGLFFQVVRIIKEMRAATGGEYPKYAVLENVPGMYSSGKGRDFLEVLNELCKIKDDSVSVPMPESGKWSTAGEIVGDGFSVAYRTLNSQFWGVPQRRRRCYIVVDFTGECAGKILFDESRLRGNPPQGGFPWKEAAGCPADGAGSAIGFEPGAASRLGGHCWENLTGTLRADAGDNQAAVVYDARGNGGGDIVGTITGDHESRVTDYTSLAMEPKTLKIRSGCEGGGKGALVQDNLSATLSTSNDQMVFVPIACGIFAYESNAMRSPNPEAGVYTAATARTLDTSGDNPGCNQGGIAVVAFAQNQRDEVRDLHDCAGALAAHPGAKQQTYVLQGSMIGRADKNGPQGDGVNEDVSFTLTGQDRHGVAYAMTTGCFTQVYEETAPTLQARDYKDAPAVAQSQYVVRRLTPTECALLQGFPSDWCAGLETPEPTEEDIAFWSEVWETQRKIAGTSSKPKSRNQIIKWLQNPHTDSAEYMMWGNGATLQVIVFVLGGIVHSTQIWPR